jgi:regulator of protease activity HflC (stomatin/prohibitin superfamily)
MIGLIGYISLAGIYVLGSSLKIVKEYERGVKFTLGRFAGIMKPGLRIVIPIIQKWERVDTRLNVVDVPHQDCITKDNISLRVNAVLYFKVNSVDRAIIAVENYLNAVSQLAQTTMKNVVGEVTLDELLSKRESISKKIESIVDKATDPWGIEVQTVEIKDVALPDQMKRAMAKEAESERERRALIISSEGEKLASENLMVAAKQLGLSKGSMHLRTLHELSDISSDESNNVIFAIPIDGLGALEGKK